MSEKKITWQDKMEAAELFVEKSGGCVVAERFMVLEGMADFIAVNFDNSELIIGIFGEGEEFSDKELDMLIGVLEPAVNVWGSVGIIDLREIALHKFVVTESNDEFSLGYSVIKKMPMEKLNELKDCK